MKRGYTLLDRRVVSYTCVCVSFGLASFGGVPRGCIASAPHGEHEAPCGPILEKKRNDSLLLTGVLYEVTKGMSIFPNSHFTRKSL